MIFHRSIASRILVLCIAACLLAACQSLEERAPTLQMLGTVQESQSIAQGRDIYITRCTKCHSAEPVRRYSARRWECIMPEMSEKTKLNAAEEAAVRAYIAAVLQMPAQ